MSKTDVVYQRQRGIRIHFVVPDQRIDFVVQPDFTFIPDFPLNFNSGSGCIFLKTAISCAGNLPYSSIVTVL